jgi:hypothetical protein
MFRKSDANCQIRRIVSVPLRLGSRDDLTRLGRVRRIRNRVVFFHFTFANTDRGKPTGSQILTGRGGRATLLQVGLRLEADVAAMRALFAFGS